MAQQLWEMHLFWQAFTSVPATLETLVRLPEHAQK